jgi:hypothetical protein
MAVASGAGKFRCIRRRDPEQIAPFAFSSVPPSAKVTINIDCYSYQTRFTAPVRDGAGLTFTSIYTLAA